MNLSKLKTYLTALLIIIIGSAAAASGIRLGQIVSQPMDDNASKSASEILDRPAPNSKYNVLLMGTDASG